MNYRSNVKNTRNCPVSVIIDDEKKTEFCEFLSKKNKKQQKTSPTPNKQTNKTKRNKTLYF